MHACAQHHVHCHKMCAPVLLNCMRGVHTSDGHLKQHWAISAVGQRPQCSVKCSVSPPAGCSAYSVPFADGDRENLCQKDSCSRYLKDPQLGHWYGKNMLPGYGPKTTPLPLAPRPCQRALASRKERQSAGDCAVSTCVGGQENVSACGNADGHLQGPKEGCQTYGQPTRGTVGHH